MLRNIEFSTEKFQNLVLPCVLSSIHGTQILFWSHSGLQFVTVHFTTSKFVYWKPILVVILSNPIMLFRVYCCDLYWQLALWFVLTPYLLHNHCTTSQLISQPNQPVQITTLDAQQHNAGYAQPTLDNPYTKTRLP
jgi:hypothetical protein